MHRPHPQDLPVRQYGDPISEIYHGKDANDAEAEKKGNERFNTGSTGQWGM